MDKDGGEFDESSEDDDQSEVNKQGNADGDVEEKVGDDDDEGELTIFPVSINW
jgi:hypothetical protein